MEQVKLTITENCLIAENTWRMVLSGEVGAITVPGQFINLALPGHFLRRPISVSDVSLDGDEGTGASGTGAAGTGPAGIDSAGTGASGTVTILYKVAGKGTEEMTAYPVGTTLDVLTGLGNGFDLTKVPEGQTALLLGGGIGSAPMLMLTKALVRRGVKVSAVLGFNSAKDVILADELQKAGAEVTVMTADGSVDGSGNEDAAAAVQAGSGPETVRDGSICFEKGFATDAEIVKTGAYDYFYACGPSPMLKAVYKACPGAGELSFEERMGCGFGACMGCSMQTASGPKRVCKDGPVFARSELLWD